MSTLFSFVFVLIITTQLVTSQRTFTCPNNGLQSPPAVMHGAARPEDIEWEVDPNNPNVYKYELVFDGYVKEWFDNIHQKYRDYHHHAMLSVH